MTFQAAKIIFNNKKSDLCNNTLYLQLLLFFVCALCLLSNLDAQFADYMETRNFVTAREIIKNNNWLVPTMNGELRLEKPPLPTWITAISMLLFKSDNLFFLRLPAALAGCILIQYVFLFMVKVSSRRFLSFMSAATVATSFYVAFQARTGTWDIYCHAFMMGAIYHLYVALRSETIKMKDFLLPGLYMGLSAMSKGPVSFYALLLPFLIAFFTQNKIGKKTIAPLLITISITALIGSWWTIYLSLFHQEELTQVYLKESTAWVSYNTRPFYHYWWFAAQSGIWTIGAVAALCYGFAAKRVNNVSNYWLLFIWAIGGVVLLSLIPEKKERYLMPVLIPLGMLTASLFYALSKEEGRSKIGRLILDANNILFLVISAAIPIFFFASSSIIGKSFDIGTQIKALLIGIIFVVLFIFALKKKESIRTWTTITAFFSIVICSLMADICNVMTDKTYKPLTHLRENADYQNYFVYYGGEFLRMELVWQGGKQINCFDQNVATHNKTFVLISYKPTDLVLKENGVHAFKITPIGSFNSSWNGRRENLFHNNIALIEVK